MVINIRGTSGSGKSTVVRRVMEKFPFRPVLLGRSTVGYLCEDPPVYVLGDYDSSQCGGCDKIRRQDEVCGLIRAHYPHRNVLFEGLLISTIYQRYSELALEVEAQGYGWVFVLLSTPYRECVDRILRRRHQQGNTRPFDPSKTRDKYELQKRHYDQLRGAGHRVVRMKDATAVEKICEWLGHGRLAWERGFGHQHSGDLGIGKDDGGAGRHGALPV